MLQCIKGQKGIFGNIKLDELLIFGLGVDYSPNIVESGIKHCITLNPKVKLLYTEDRITNRADFTIFSIVHLY